MKIEMGKQYRTLDGREVEIFAVKDGRVWGREKDGRGTWVSNSWDINNVSPYLVEVKPEITRTVFLVHEHKRCPSAFQNKADAETWAKLSDRPIAITGPHTVTFTEGEGL